MEEQKQSKVGLVFDIAFELVLCFAVLLLAMLLTRNDVIGGPYEINFIKTGIVVIAIVALLALIVIKSQRHMDSAMEQLQEEGFGKEVENPWQQ